MAENKSTILIQAIDRASKTFKSVGARLGDMTKAALTSKIGIAALSATVGLAVRDFAVFQEKVANVVNLFQGSKKDIDDYSAALIDMSTRVPKSTDDLADSLFDVISAGVDVGESLKFLEVSAKLAVAGVTDTKVAVDGLTSIMNAYGIESSRVNEISDKFFAAQVEGKTTIQELSSYIGQVAPIANAAGVGIDELFGSVSSLTKQGVKTAQAVTQVRATISSLLKPSKEAQAAAGELGIEFNAAALKSKGLTGVLQDVITATGGNTEAIAKLFPQVESLNGVLALSKNEFQDLISIQEEVAESTGTTEKAYQQQAELMSTNIKLLTNEIKAFSKDAVALLEPVINGFLKISKFAVSGLRSIIKPGNEARKNLEEILKVTNMTAKDFAKLSKEQQKAMYEMVKNGKTANEEIEGEQKRHNEEVEEAQDEHAQAILSAEDDLHKDQVKRLKIVQDSIIKEIAKRNAIEEDLRDERTEKEIAGLQVMLSETQIALRDRSDAYNADNEKILDEYGETLDEMSRRTNNINTDIARQTATLGSQMVTDFQGFAQTLIQNTISGPGGITDQLFTELSKTMGTTAASFTSGAIGGVVSMGVAEIVSGVFGKSGKTVHDYAEEAYDRMVDRTNEKLLQLGRERTQQEKQLDILEELSDSLGGSAIIPDKFLTALGLKSGTTVDSGRVEILGRSVKGNEVERSVLEKELSEAQRAKSIFDQYLSLISSAQSEYQNVYDSVYNENIQNRISPGEARTRAYDVAYNRVSSSIDRANELAYTSFLLNGKMTNLGEVSGLRSDKDTKRFILDDDASANVQSRGALNGLNDRINQLNAELNASSFYSLDEVLDQIKLLSKIADITGNAPKFSTGGLVGGSSYTGDRVLAKVDSGERIMTAATDAQLQATLATIQKSLSGMNAQPMVIELKLDKKVLSREIVNLNNQRKAGLL